MSLAGRLYRGETDFPLVEHRRRWYLASAILLVVCLASFVIRGFNFGIEFAGGNQYLVPTSANATVASIRDAVSAQGVEVASSQQVGSGANKQILVRTPELKPAQSAKVKAAIAKTAGVNPDRISDDSVSSSWGRDVTTKALTGLVAFLVAVSAYMAFRFEPKMAFAAIAALFHDVIVAAGLYSIIGFEVTPSTIVGLLTILGFSLYDTVVVFDKVAENTKGLLGGSRSTYAEAANLAVNQTFMRSINTSVIALLPVAGLLFVGAGLLGVGTLKDLALVLFVGLASGAYSSLFLATPVLVDLKEREPAYAALRQRVLARRSGAVSSPTRRAARGGATVMERSPVPTAPAPPTVPPVVTVPAVPPVVAEPEREPEVTERPAPVSSGATRMGTPRPGPRPGGPGTRKKGGRPSGTKRKRR